MYTTALKRRTDKATYYKIKKNCHNMHSKCIAYRKELLQIAYIWNL